MARGREGIAKRARERARQERQEAKRLKREASADEGDDPSDVDEAGLMEEFRLLSERHDAGDIPEGTYAAERNRIFAELGIETGGE